MKSGWATHHVGTGDASPDEPVAAEAGQVVQRPGLQVVEHRHRRLVLEQPANKVGADEPRPTGYQNRLGTELLLKIRLHRRSKGGAGMEIRGALR